MTMPQHPSALSDMMALLRVIEDPKATQAVLDAIAEAREKAMADLEHREAAFTDACVAREKALQAREEALKQGEADLSRRRDRLTAALAGMPGGAR